MHKKVFVIAVLFAVVIVAGASTGGTGSSGSSGGSGTGASTGGSTGSTGSTGGSTGSTGSTGGSGCVVVETGLNETLINYGAQTAFNLTSNMTQQFRVEPCESPALVDTTKIVNIISVTATGPTNAWIYFSFKPAPGPKQNAVACQLGGSACRLLIPVATFRQASGRPDLFVAVFNNGTSVATGNFKLTTRVQGLAYYDTPATIFITGEPHSVVAGHVKPHSPRLAVSLMGDALKNYEPGSVSIYLRQGQAPGVGRKCGTQIKTACYDEAGSLDADQYLFDDVYLLRRTLTAGTAADAAEWYYLIIYEATTSYKLTLDFESLDALPESGASALGLGSLPLQLIAACAALLALKLA